MMPIVVLAASAGCDRSHPASSTRGAPESAAVSADSRPDAWAKNWSKEAFAHQDSLKLWNRFSSAAHAELSKPGADPSDLTAQADALGADPEKVFEFMRDQITLEPYAGVLRGARGTLAAGAGNALDRVLLAKELLRLKGVESRIVAGRLSDAQADTLLARFLGSSQVPKALADLLAPPSTGAMQAQAAEFATKVGISEKAAADLADHMREETEAFWSGTNAQIANQFDSLHSQLGRTSLKMAVDAGALTAKLRARLRQHYWLQVREPGGAWTAFDPAFPDRERGSAHTPQAVTLSELPDSLYHKLALTLIYETTSDGAPKQDTVVAGTYASADALFQSIEFQIQPTELAADAGTLVAMDAKTRVETVRNLNRFQGLLFAKGVVTAGRKFDFEGNTYDPTSGPMLKPAGGTFADALGGAESAVRFVELRAVLRLTGPGREPLIQNRTIVRGSDVAAATFAPPILEWEILLQPQWIPDDFVAFRSLDQALAFGDALYQTSAGDLSVADLRRANSASPVALGVALLRETAVAGVLASRTDVRALIDAPMLTILGHELARTDNQGEEIVATRSLDIVENGITYVPVSDSAAAPAFDAALRQGVADCTLEDRVLGAYYPGMANKSGMTILAQAKAEQRPVLLAKTQDIDALRSTGVTETDINWIYDNELPDSRLVVATTASGLDAWWSVRPNGTAILRTNGGRGQDVVEHTVHLGHIAMNVLCGLEIYWTASDYVHGHHVGGGAMFGIAMCVTMGGMSHMFAAGTYGAAHGIQMAILFADLYFTYFSHLLLE